MTIGDKEKADEAGLEICDRCGWYASRFQHTCTPTAGRVADALVREVPEISSTKLGYGDGHLTFEISEDTHVRFAVHEHGEISLREVYSLVDLDIDQAAAIVRAIAKILGDSK